LYLICPDLERRKFVPILINYFIEKMSSPVNNNLSTKIDGALLALYLILCCIGIFAIFSVEYKSNDLIHFTLSKNFAKQALFLGLSLVTGFIIILMDSRFFTNLAFGGYVFGIALVLFVHDSVKGSNSFLPLGFFKFQPGELAKIFTSLTLAKYLASQEVDFAGNRQHKLIAIGIVLLPCILVKLSDETGLALVYLSLFLAMYREGLPNIVMIIFGCVLTLTILTLAVQKNTLFILLTLGLVATLVAKRKSLKRNRELVVVAGIIWVISVLFSQVIVPYTFKHVLKGYQVDRIYTMLGQEMPAEYVRTNEKGEKQKSGSSQYNVVQSKIAIGSGGFIGQGPLNGTQTQGNFVPEQRTDFIFCSIGEQFGWVGSTILIALYVLFLLRIIAIGERQRSKFTRIYAYCLAGIVFFHLFINIGMTIGLAPVIGIPLPMLSYGGTSLLTFSMLFFILLRLDMDRNIALR
jgi:rod shape determining protein RodA